jgi:hypothetical protein
MYGKLAVSSIDGSSNLIFESISNPVDILPASSKI